jgi:hypothetical protein
MIYFTTLVSVCAWVYLSTSRFWLVCMDNLQISQINASSDVSLVSLGSFSQRWLSGLSHDQRRMVSLPAGRKRSVLQASGLWLSRHGDALR